MVQRIRIRYAKRGPLRFTSHRDFARAFERALRRAAVPVAFSQGFTPHPKISYASAAPTGMASEAEYLEIGLRAEVDPARVRADLDAALSPGLDVLDVVVVTDPGALADRLEASRWRIELPGVDPEQARRAVAAFRDAAEVPVERLTKQGRRRFDARGPVTKIDIVPPPVEVTPVPCAILDLVVRQVSPSVRPDDVLSALRAVAGLTPTSPARITRVAQGTLAGPDVIRDPLRADHTEHDGVVNGTPVG